MALVTEAGKWGRATVHVYSDSGVYIEREDGQRFAEAYDVEGAGHSYAETEETLPEDETGPETEGA